VPHATDRPRRAHGISTSPCQRSFERDPRRTNGSTVSLSRKPLTEFGHMTRHGQVIWRISVSQLPAIRATRASCQPDRSFLAIGLRIAFCLAGGWNMPLVNLVVALIIVGVALYLINRYIPMASSIKSILNVVVVVAVAVWVLQAVGLWGGLTNFRVGR
jgi:hypothetical protein